MGGSYACFEDGCKVELHQRQQVDVCLRDDGVGLVAVAARPGTRGNSKPRPLPSMTMPDTIASEADGIVAASMSKVGSGHCSKKRGEKRSQHVQEDLFLQE